MEKELITKTTLLMGGTALLGFTLAGCQNQPSSAASLGKPNVVFIMCDDLNDYQGVFGGHPQAKTPNIDRLAASGVQFVNAQSNSPVSQPSRNSLFTGVYSHVSHDYGWTQRLKQPVLKNNKPLMAMFKENGYYTLGSGKLLHGNREPELWDDWGMNNKHDYGPFVKTEDNKCGPHHEVPAPYNEIGPIDGSFGPLSTAGPLVYGWDMKPLRYNSREDRDLLQDELHAEWAVKKLKELEHSAKPFFMGIGFVRPHTPLHAPDEYFDMFPLESLELAPWMADDDADTFLQNFEPANSKGYRYYRTLLESYGGDREVAIKHFLQAYLACVAFVDAQVGKVVDAIDHSSLKSNTVVVFTADHGWQMGEKNFLFKNSPWEESARIPMIIRHPRIPGGKKVEQPVSLIDMYPTMMDICGLQGDNRLNPSGGELGGHSMLPLMQGKEWEGPQGALSIVANRGPQTTVMDQHYSYRTKDYRYIIYSDGSEELYDHRTDPFEWNNLASDASLNDLKADLYKQICDIIGVDLKRK